MFTTISRSIPGASFFHIQAFRGTTASVRVATVTRPRGRLITSTAATLFQVTSPAISGLLIPRDPIRQKLALAFKKEIPHCGNQCTCNYNAEKESLIDLQRCVIVSFSGAILGLIGMKVLDVLQRSKIDSAKAANANEPNDEAKPAPGTNPIKQQSA